MEKIHFHPSFIQIYTHNLFRATGPSTIYNSGVVYFYQIPSCIFRKHGPAGISPDGTIIYHNARDVLHRTTGPAVIRLDGVKEYWVDGKQVSVDEFFATHGVL